MGPHGTSPREPGRPEYPEQERHSGYKELHAPTEGSHEAQSWGASTVCTHQNPNLLKV